MGDRSGHEEAATGDEPAPRGGLGRGDGIRLLVTAADAELGRDAIELAGTYPGDELVPDPTGGATMATFLAAPPEEVWPWLVQMGGGRAGWYSWDWVDNGGEPSADHIVPSGRAWT